MLFLALVEIILLWAALLITILYFRKISKSAAILLLPYLLWLTFAVILNAAFYLLNK
jgi:tryptophan-rich sensory protein